LDRWRHGNGRATCILRCQSVSALYATALGRRRFGVSPSRLVTSHVMALTQSILPVFVGGLADRFGYKRTIFVSTIIKYPLFVMAGYPRILAFFWCHPAGYWYCIFKPGIQVRWCIQRARKTARSPGVLLQLVMLEDVGPCSRRFCAAGSHGPACSMLWRYHRLQFHTPSTYREPRSPCA